MKIFTLLILTTTLFAYTPAAVDEITDEFLEEVAQQTGHCDHVPHIQKIFENYKVKTLLEFGLGYSTKRFLDHCSKVISVEYVTASVPPDWIRYCLNLYKGYSNWIPVAYFSNYSGNFDWAPYKFFATAKLWEAGVQQGYNCNAPVDDGYLVELKTFITNLTKYNKVDLALVDPPHLLRGPLVQLLFDKAPIILAADCCSVTNPQLPDVYGYRRVETPDNYERIIIRKGKIVLLWIQKSEATQNLIDVMKDYAQTP